MNNASQQPVRAPPFSFLSLEKHGLIRADEIRFDFCLFTKKDRANINRDLE
jgi:hypothetical protein